MLNLTGSRSAKEGVKFMQKMHPKKSGSAELLKETNINTSQLRFQVSSSVQNCVLVCLLGSPLR